MGLVHFIRHMYIAKQAKRMRMAAARTRMYYCIYVCFLYDCICSHYYVLWVRVEVSFMRDFSGGFARHSLFICDDVTKKGQRDFGRRNGKQYK